MYIKVNTGTDALVAGVDPVDAADLGVRFSTFRTLDRFDEQLDKINFGMISWPGGSLAEAYPDRYGLQHPGLYNPAFGQADLADMMAYARAHDAALAIVLPTARFAGNEELMREEVGNFMADLLSGSYGPLPKQLVFHIGSEHYLHFNSFGDDAAAEYGKVAAAMVDEINAWLDDPLLNQNGIDIDLAVQAGRNMADDEAIRDAFTPDQLAEIDMVLHHRYPGTAEGVDITLKQFAPIFDAWKADVTAAGGDKPELNLGEWNVASITREEALTKYIRDMKAEGITIKRGDIDLAGRTDTEFEKYWQDILATRDYGVEAPRLYLELFSEYQAEGTGAASLHSWDMMHAGRASYVDASGAPVKFVGAEMFDMIAESTEGLSVMDISTRNSRFSDDLWTYGFENDDRLVLFLSADDDVKLGKVTLDIEGLSSGYSAIWVESLTAEVPKDWMTRFGIPDNPNVDESNEANTYALGHREDLPFSVNRGKLTFSIDHPGEVVRVIVARTPEEAREIAEFAGEPDFVRTQDRAEPAPPRPSAEDDVAAAPPPTKAPPSRRPAERDREDDDDDQDDPVTTRPGFSPFGIGSRLSDISRIFTTPRVWDRRASDLTERDPDEDLRFGSLRKVNDFQQRPIDSLFRRLPETEGMGRSWQDDDQDDDDQDGARFADRSGIGTIADALATGGYGGLLAMVLSNAF